MSTEIPALPVSSSRPPEFPPGAVAYYTMILEALQDAGVPHVIAGAFALHHHTGIWRTTKDLDIFLEAKSVPEALASLEGRGFATHIEDPVWLAKAVHGEHFVDLITAMGNAVLAVDASWIARATPCVVVGVPCLVLGVEEMIASKVFVARRERFDGADVAHLIRARGKNLDWDRVQLLLEPHWEMLLWSLVFFSYAYPSHLNVVPQRVWNDLLCRLADRVEHPRADEPFRGMLLDPNMFAIDAAERGERDLYREFREDCPVPLEASVTSGKENPK